MTCTCDGRNGNAPTSLAYLTICCPENSAIVNGACGCNSTTTATAFYVASSVPESVNYSIESNSQYSFTCKKQCPENS